MAMTPDEVSTPYGKATPDTQLLSFGGVTGLFCRSSGRLWRGRGVAGGCDGAGRAAAERAGGAGDSPAPHALCGRTGRLLCPRLALRGTRHYSGPIIKAEILLAALVLHLRRMRSIDERPATLPTCRFTRCDTVLRAGEACASNPEGAVPMALTASGQQNVWCSVLLYAAELRPDV